LRDRRKGKAAEAGVRQVVRVVQSSGRMKCLFWIALALAACGKSSDHPAGSNAGAAGDAPGAPVAAGPQDRCEVHVTGAQTVDIVATKPRRSHDPRLSVGSEYWLTEDELRSALGVMLRIGGNKPSKAEVDRKVDEEMKKDPRLWLLIMHCSTEDGFLNLSASNSSTSKDVPFGPHSYVIASDAKAGEFTGMFALKQGKHVSYHLAAPGKLEIARFDATGIAATFSFEAETYDRTKHVAVKGSFDFGCAGQNCK
jgi:hypothetical protein